MLTEGHLGPSVNGKRAFTLLSKDCHDQLGATQMLPKHTRCFSLTGVCVGLAKTPFSSREWIFYFTCATP